MPEQVVKQRSRGFICVTAHPEGCARNVEQQIAAVKRNRPKSISGPRSALVIGSSTGYGAGYADRRRLGFRRQDRRCLLRTSARRTKNRRGRILQHGRVPPLGPSARALCNRDQRGCVFRRGQAPSRRPRSPRRRQVGLGRLQPGRASSRPSPHGRSVSGRAEGNRKLLPRQDGRLYERCGD